MTQPVEIPFGPLTAADDRLVLDHVWEVFYGDNLNMSRVPDECHALVKAGRMTITRDHARRGWTVKSVAPGFRAQCCEAIGWDDVAKRWNPRANSRGPDETAHYRSEG